MFCCLLINSDNESSTIGDKFLHLYNLFTIILFCQVAPSAYSVGIVSYNLLWRLSLRWGLFSMRTVPADSSSVTLLRFILCCHSRSVVIHCHYAIVVLCSRILLRLFIYHVYFTFDNTKTLVSQRTRIIVGNSKQWDFAFSVHQRF